jgi:ABC-type Fe3+ transport system substrate-binding protein
MSESSSGSTVRRVTRRAVLAFIGAGTAGLVAACTSSAPVVPTEPPKPTAPPRWGMTAEQAAAWQQTEDAARKEAKVVYYAVGSIPQNRIDAFKSRWAKDFPQIQLDVLFIGNNAAVMSRIQSEQDSKTYVGDVSETAIFNALRVDLSQFEAFTPPATRDPNAKYLVDPVTVDRGKAIHTSCMAQYYPFWINTNLLKPEQTPNSYQDLVSTPALKGQIMWRRPWSTGGGNHTFMITRDTYGPDWATKMKALEPTFAEDQDAALLQVARGEFALGLGLTGRTAGQLIRDGQPLRAVWPEDIGIRVSNGYVLLNKAPHMNAAKVLINWMMTRPGQELWQELGQFPFDTTVPPAEEWMKGYARSKTQWENLTPEQDLRKALDDAARIFKQ